MGIFEDKKSKQIEFLEEERKKLWTRLIALEKTNSDIRKEIQKNTSDSEKEAAQSSRKASEFKNKTEQKLEEATNLVSKVEEQLLAAVSVQDNIIKTEKEISLQKESIIQIKERLDESEDAYNESWDNLNNKITKLDSFLEKYPELDPNIEEVEEFIKEIEENLQKSSISLLNLNKKKKEVDDLHRVVFGYTQTDELGKVTKIDGQKDELEDIYEGLSKEIEGAVEKLEDLQDNYSKKYEKYHSEHETKYQSITSEISSLLPNALTAGLSAAFSSKKDEEVESSKILQTRFSHGIYLLIVVSIIPFIVSIVFLFQGVELEEAIRKIPRLVLAIIPMYIPVLWFTYSANKKLNLSKRLIEEYAHKEVLSKTYEGLTKQITNIEDPSQSSELKFRLLSNFLQVSSENPGKLISNYEASDHPIMEALEQSYKFQIAIDRLEGIPGLGKVAAILETKAKRKINDKKAKIENALDDKESLEAEV